MGLGGWGEARAPSLRRLVPPTTCAALALACHSQYRPRMVITEYNVSAARACTPSLSRESLHCWCPMGVGALRASERSRPSLPQGFVPGPGATPAEAAALRVSIDPTTPGRWSGTNYYGEG